MNPRQIANEFTDKELNALRELVWAAQHDATLTYKELGEKVGLHYHRAVPSALGHLRDRIFVPRKLPLLNCLVLNAGRKMPGDSYLPSAHTTQNNDEYREFCRHRTKAFAYSRWDDLLEELRLDPLQYNDVDMAALACAAARKLVNYGGGEGKEHKALREAIHQDPGLVGLPDCRKAETESILPSGDRVDVRVWPSRGSEVLIEVKVCDNIQELTRGVFQCIKYRAVVAADHGRTPRVLLAAYSLHPQVVAFARRHGVATKLVPKNRE